MAQRKRSYESRMEWLEAINGMLTCGEGDKRTYLGMEMFLNKKVTINRSLRAKGCHQTPIENRKTRIYTSNNAPVCRVK
jgi:hypothetical protein